MPQWEQSGSWLAGSAEEVSHSCERGSSQTQRTAAIMMLISAALTLGRRVAIAAGVAVVGGLSTKLMHH